MIASNKIKDIRPKTKFHLKSAERYGKFWREDAMVKYIVNIE
jgi:hypothetical protein